MPISARPGMPRSGATTTRSNCTGVRPRAWPKSPPSRGRRTCGDATLALPSTSQRATPQSTTSPPAARPSTGATSSTTSTASAPPSNGKRPSTWARLWRSTSDSSRANTANALMCSSPGPASAASNQSQAEKQANASESHHSAYNSSQTASQPTWRTHAPQPASGCHRRHRMRSDSLPVPKRLDTPQLRNV